MKEEDFMKVDGGRIGQDTNRSSAATQTRRRRRCSFSDETDANGNHGKVVTDKTLSRSNDEQLHQQERQEQQEQQEQQKSQNEHQNQDQSQLYASSLAGSTPVSKSNVSALQSSAKRSKSVPTEAEVTKAAAEEEVDVENLQLPRIRSVTPGLDFGMERTSSDKSILSNSTASTPTKMTKTVAEPLGVVVHRLRPPTMSNRLQQKQQSSLFYEPSAVVAIAAMPTETYQTSGGLLAVSYENGSVELLSVHHKFRTIGLVPGLKKPPSSPKTDTSVTDSTTVVTCMDWLMPLTITHLSRTDRKTSPASVTPSPVLVGGMASGYVAIIDFSTSSMQALKPSGGGGIFCTAPFFTREYHESNLDTNQHYVGHGALAIGCEDGVIRIIHVANTNDNTRQSLHIASSFPSAGSPILSLATLGESDIFATPTAIVFAGVADGTIRRYDRQQSKHPLKKTTTISSTWACTLRITVECWGRTVPTKVWSMVALQSFTAHQTKTQLITADSLGHIQIWNGYIGTLEQTFFHNDQQADVLSVAVSTSNANKIGTDKLFAAGIDPRVVTIERTGLQQQPRHRQHRWVLTNGHNTHTHDVKAVRIVPFSKECYNHGDISGTSTTTPSQELLVSGGIDQRLCVYGLAEYPKVRPTFLLPMPSYGTFAKGCNRHVAIANRARFMLVCHPTNGFWIDIYKLVDQKKVNDGKKTLLQPPPTHTTGNATRTAGATSAQTPSNIRNAMCILPNSVSDDHSSNLICSMDLNDANLLSNNILAMAIRNDGKFLAVTDANRLLLFHLCPKTLTTDNNLHHEQQRNRSFTSSSSSSGIRVVESYESHHTTTLLEPIRIAIHPTVQQTIASKASITALAFLPTNDGTIEGNNNIACLVVATSSTSSGFSLNHNVIHFIAITKLKNNLKTRNNTRHIYVASTVIQSLVEDDKNEGDIHSNIMSTARTTSFNNNDNRKNADVDVGKSNKLLPLCIHLPINTISISDDGNWFYTFKHDLAALTTTKSQAPAIQIYGRIVINNDNNSAVHSEFRHYWSIPSIPNEIISVASFVPSSPSASKQTPTSTVNKSNESNQNSTDMSSWPRLYLAVATMKHSVYVFDILRRRLSPWSEQAGYPLISSSSSLSQNNVPILHPYDFPLHIAINPVTPTKLIVVYRTGLLSMDMSLPYPTRYCFSPADDVRAIKYQRMKDLDDLQQQQQQLKIMSNTRQCNENTADVNMVPSSHDDTTLVTTNAVATIFLKYNNILQAEFLDANELIVLEQPWSYIIPTLPDALERKFYGTG